MARGQDDGEIVKREDDGERMRDEGRRVGWVRRGLFGTFCNNKYKEETHTLEEVKKGRYNVK